MSLAPSSSFFLLSCLLLSMSLPFSRVFPSTLVSLLVDAVLSPLFRPPLLRCSLLPQAPAPSFCLLYCLHTRAWSSPSSHHHSPRTPFSCTSCLLDIFPLSLPLPPLVLAFGRMPAQTSFLPISLPFVAY